MKISSILTLMSLIFLTGCGADGPPFSGFIKPEKGKGVLYVYRPSSFFGAGVSYDVKNKTDDNVVGYLRNGGFIKQQMNPGEKTIWAQPSLIKTTEKITIKEGEISCIKGEVGIGILIARPILNKIDLNKCKAEIKETVESIE